jgi:hypothetical protein
VVKCGIAGKTKRSIIGKGASPKGVDKIIPYLLPKGDDNSTTNMIQWGKAEREREVK